MANECNKTFESQVTLDDGTVRDKGQIEIDRHTGNKITGRLKVGGRTIEFDRDSGRCLPHRSDRIIRFEITNGSEKDVYHGIFKVRDRKIEGSFFKRGGGPGDGDTGTWEATQH